MANNSFTARFDFDGAARLADRIDSLASSAFVRLSAVDAANAVATRFDIKARKAMNLGLNLSDSYIEQRVKLTRATVPASGPARAEIVAEGDLTILGHYPHQQLRQPGTQLRKGPSRGRRPSGVAAEIRKGQAEIVPQWFTMRLRVGTQAGDRVGVFYRDSDGKVTHKYGPSPYSLFRFQINELDDELAADLEQTAVDFAAKAIRKGLT